MGRELWGFGPAYFSGGLYDGELEEACPPLDAFLSWRPGTDHSDVMWDDYGEWGRRRLKDEKRHVNHFDSRGSRERQADLRITFEARPTDEVVLRLIDGPGTRTRTSTSAIGHTARPKRLSK